MMCSALVNTGLMRKAHPTMPRLQVVSHNVRRFRFALPAKKMVLGLPVGAHISLKGTDADGKDVMRPYTPVSDDNLRGYVDFVIKVCQISWKPF